MSQRPESAPKVAPFGCILVFAVPLGLFGLGRLFRMLGAIGDGNLMVAFSAGSFAFVGIALAALMVSGHRKHSQGPIKPVFPPPPIFYVMGFLVLVNTGLSTSQAGVDRLQGLRALERTAPTVIGAVLPGPVNLSGAVDAVAGDSLLRSPETKTAVVYYRHLIERDSDDNWRTVSDVSRSVPFYIEDGTGRIRVEPVWPVTIRPTLDYQAHSDGMRYSEYRIQPGDTVVVRGDALLRDEDDLAGPLVVSFSHESLHPIISKRTEAAERSSVGLISILYSWAGLALLSFSVVFLFGAFRWHNSVAYLTAVVVMLMGALIGQSHYMLRSDLDQAQIQVEQHLETAERSIAALSDAGAGADRIRRIRIDAAGAVDRHNATLARFPERLFAAAWGFEPLATHVLAEEEAREVHTLRDARPPTRLVGWWVFLPVLGGLIAGLALARGGLRAVSVKRMIENIPTSPVRGVCYGLAEVKGVAQAGETGALMAPLAKEKACWYRYTIEEEHGTGKDRRWVEIHRDESVSPFLCADASGVIEVHPRDAEILTHHKTEWQKGIKRHREHRIHPDDELYVLGFADIHPETRAQLLLRGTDPADLPFIISAEPEATVLYRKGAWGRWLLNASLASLVLSALFGLAAASAVSPTGYMAATLVGWVFLLLLVLVLHYNDLVFLRHRVERNRSNIDIALKKRFDLTGQMEAVLRETAAHERTLHERMAALRSCARSDQQSSSAGRSGSIHPVAASVRALREAYPDLQSSHAFARLTQTLSGLEDEIALMRDGYNDAVERLNTRVQSLPDILLARPFGFRPLPFLHFEAEPSHLSPPQAWGVAGGHS
jgi:hypothetical protein